MDLAARVWRRSNAKLKAFHDGGSAELRIAMSETADVRSAARTLSETQSAACRHMVQWSVKQGNPAIQDAATQMEELNNLLAAAILEYSEGAGHFSKVYSGLTEDERQLNCLRLKVVEAEKKVFKVREELKRALKKSSDKVQQLQTKLSEAERSKGVQQIELAQHTRESEAVKCIRFKEGIRRLGEAGIQFSVKCLSIYQALQDLASYMPDAAAGEPDGLEYNGFAEARQRVAQARREVEQQHLRLPAADDCRLPASGQVHVSAASCSTGSSISRAGPPAAQSSSLSWSRRQCCDASSSAELAERPPPYSPGSYYEHSSIAGSRRRRSGSNGHRCTSTRCLDATVVSRFDDDAPSFTAFEAAATSTPRALPAGGGGAGHVTVSSSGYFSIAESPVAIALSSSFADGTRATEQQQPSRQHEQRAVPSREPSIGLSSERDQRELDGRSVSHSRRASADHEDDSRHNSRPQTTAASPKLERPVERQVLYRNTITADALRRQSSTSSSTGRRRRHTPSAISSPD